MRRNIVELLHVDASRDRLKYLPHMRTSPVRNASPVRVHSKIKYERVGCVTTLRDIEHWDGLRRHTTLLDSRREPPGRGSRRLAVVKAKSRHMARFWLHVDVGENCVNRRSRKIHSPNRKGHEVQMTLPLERAAFWASCRGCHCFRVYQPIRKVVGEKGGLLLSLSFHQRVFWEPQPCVDGQHLRLAKSNGLRSLQPQVTATDGEQVVARMWARRRTFSLPDFVGLPYACRVPSATRHQL